MEFVVWYDFFVLDFLSFVYFQSFPHANLYPYSPTRVNHSFEKVVRSNLAQLNAMFLAFGF